MKKTTVRGRLNSNAAPGDREAVERLERCWDRLWSARHGAEEAELHELLRRWEPPKGHDPIALKVDLLSPLGSARHEPSHTLALAYLLDPAGDHGLGREPLELLLDLLYERLASEAQPTFEAAAKGWVDAAVVAERAALLKLDREDTRRRTDLWIEIPARTPRLLIIVENKIDDVARSGQLAAYEEVIAARVARMATPPLVVKVFLTVTGEEPAPDAGGRGWLPLSYAALPLAWSPLVDGESTPGRTYLRLYLATVVQKLLGFRFIEAMPRRMLGYFVAYLRVRLEGQSNE